MHPLARGGLITIPTFRRDTSLGYMRGVMRRAEANGITPQVPMYNAVLKRCAERGTPASGRHAFQIVQEMLVGGPADWPCGDKCIVPPGHCIEWAPMCDVCHLPKRFIATPVCQHCVNAGTAVVRDS